MRQRERKSENSGMSLIEVIVAVSIFAIAAMVLFQGFVTSGRINRKSSEYLEATSTAQNVMEEIKSRDFEETALAFNYPVDATTGESRFTFLNPQTSRILSGELGIKEVILDGSEYKDVRKYENAGGKKENVTASVISEDGGKTYEFNAREKGANASKYYFQMTDVTNQHEEFDVLVEFDGSSSSGYKKKTSSSDKEGKNDYLMPNIAKLDTKTNAFLIMERDRDVNAMRTIIDGMITDAQIRWSESGGNVSDPPYDGMEPDFSDPEYKALYDDIYAHAKRHISIQITESGGIITAAAEYTLSAYGYDPDGYGTFVNCPCGGDSSKMGNDGLGCYCTHKPGVFPFYSSEAGLDLQGIYVFYYPNYNSQSSVNPLDEIVFDNTINHSVNLYITKQRNADGTGGLDMVQEGMYKMSLTIKEDPSGIGNGNWNTNLSLYKAKTNLRTNLDYDISDTSNIEERRSTLNQMTLVYEDMLGRRARSTAAKKVVSYNGLDDKLAYDRIYTAKVSVYKAGAAAKNFPKEDRIVSLDGAKEN